MTPTLSTGKSRAKERLAAKLQAEAIRVGVVHDTPSRQVRRTIDRAPAYRWDTRGTRRIVR